MGLKPVFCHRASLGTNSNRRITEPADDFLQIENVPDKETTMRAAVGNESLTGVQGFIFLKLY